MQGHLTVGSASSSSPIPVFDTPDTVELPEESLFRTPSVTDSTGGARSEKQASERGQMVKTADQVVQLAFENGLKVSPAVQASLLPTPAVNDMGRGKTVEAWDEWTEKMKSKHGNGNGHGASLDIEALRLLPTPVASEGTKAPAQQDAETKGKTGQVWLSNVAKGISNDTLLPTPNTMEHLPARTEEQIAESKKRSPAGYNNLREKVLHEATNWGKFEPAIKRWEEVLGRTAPAPTNPDGKDGAHRLSSAFTEWMMGLPEGWITDVGLKRNDELKACGNGVVPQQAEMALRLLLADSNMTLSA